MFEPSQKNLKFKKHILVFVAVFLCFYEAKSFAQMKDIGQRQKVRRQEGLYFSDYLTAKNKNFHQDLLYRFYTSQNSKPTPRIEPYFYGLGFTGTEVTNSNDLAQNKIVNNDAVKGTGYGGAVYFNNFVAGVTGWAMPNFVLGVAGERREGVRNEKSDLHLSWVGSVRFFAQNQQDTAFFINYRNNRRNLFGQAFQEWSWEVSSKVYLFPGLALEGASLIAQDILPGKASQFASHTAFGVGGFIEIQMFRLGMRLERENFKETKSATSQNRIANDERRMIYLGTSL